MSIAEQLEEARQRVEQLSEDVTLLEDAWRTEVPNADAVFKSIDRYLVPYYKAKGAVQLLEILAAGRIDVTNQHEVKELMDDLKGLERDHGGQLNYFRQVLAKREEPMEYESLSQETRWYVKSFYEVVGARDTFESVLDALRTGSQNAAIGD